MSVTLIIVGRVLTTLFCVLISLHGYSYLDGWVEVSRRNRVTVVGPGTTTYGVLSPP